MATMTTLSPTHGYKPTCEAAMAAFAKSWWHESLAPSRQPNTFSLLRAHAIVNRSGRPCCSHPS